MKILPTKPSLLDGSLVDFVSHHKSIATNSIKIAKALNSRHSDVKAIVRRLSKKGLIDVRRSSHIYLDNLNRKQSYFELDEQAALQVIMNLKGHNADLLHKEIAQAFVSMKGELCEWRTGRIQASESTKAANDSIFWLQGELKRIIPESKKGGLLFVHFQRAINKAVTGKAKTDRGLMPQGELKALNLLESHAKELIEEFKAEGMPAVQIREEVLGRIRLGSFQGKEFSK